RRSTPARRWLPHDRRQSAPQDAPGRMLGTTSKKCPPDLGYRLLFTTDSPRSEGIFRGNPTPTSQPKTVFPGSGRAGPVDDFGLIGAPSLVDEGHSDCYRGGVPLG